MKRTILLSCIWTLFIVGCEGSGGISATTPPSNKPDNVISLLPLNVNITDLDNTPIPYIDTSLIGSHILYKMKFTNPNSVAVTVPSANVEFLEPLSSGLYEPIANYNFADEMWLLNEAGVKNLDDYQSVMSVYYSQHNPGFYDTLISAGYFGDGYISGAFVKMPNADDCDKASSIAPGGYCAFYTYAYNKGTGYALNPTTYTYPLAYEIETLDKKSKLFVQQCTYKDFDSNGDISFDCSNESKPGYANQFIHYKFGSVNLGKSNLPFTTFQGMGSSLSGNGKWLYNCPPGASPAVCNKYKMDYDSKNLILIKESVPEIIPIATSQRVQHVYPTLDGSYAWVLVDPDGFGLSLINTANPSYIYNGYCAGGTPCVPFIGSTPLDGFNYGVTGLDGSFWWTTSVSADVYESSSGTFRITNIPGVGAVNADGTPIMAGFCYRKTSNPAIYTTQTMLNYILPNYGAMYATAPDGIYLGMPVSGLYNSLGESIVENAWYKVHTESGLCEVRLDDYAFYRADTSEYSLSSESYVPSTGSNFSLMPTANAYSGK